MVKYRVIVEERGFDVAIGPGGQVWVNQQPFRVDLQNLDGHAAYSLLVNYRSYETHVEPLGDGECRVVVAGRPYRARLVDERQPAVVTALSYATDKPLPVAAPLPGLLAEVRVTEGQHVAEGDVVAVLESMKMHLELRAPRAGVVRGLQALAGRDVALGEVLMVVEP